MSGSTELRIVRRPIYNSVEIGVKGLSSVAVTVLCATELRPMHSGGIDPLVRAAGDAGATGIHLGGGVALADFKALVPAVLRAGLTIPSMALPLAPRALAPGKRLPAQLAAADPRDERGAAIALATEGAPRGRRRRGRPVGLPGLRVRRFARVATRTSRRRSRGARSGRARRTRRTSRSGSRRVAPQAGHLSDACHWSLERLGRLAEARSVRLILPLGGSPWEVPSAREALEPRGGFRLRRRRSRSPGIPGRLDVAARALGLRLPDARVAAVAKAAGAAIESDAVGLEPGYLPGLGERAEGLAPRPRATEGLLPSSSRGSRTSTDAEIAGAVARVTALYEVEPREDEDDLLDEAEGREGDRRR